MPENDISTEPSGLLQGVPYHDSSIVRLDYAIGIRRLSIELSGYGGGLVSILMDRVVVANIQDLYEGNLVSDIFLWPVNRVPSPTSSSPDLGWLALLDRRCSSADISRQILAYKTEHAQSKLFQISSSYGLRLAVLCETISFQSR